MRRHDVLILGGGTAGITVAARLKRADRDLDVAIVEPKRVHAYKPLWTLVGAGMIDLEATRKPQARFIPKGVTWIEDRVAELDSEAHQVMLEGGDTVGYQQVVVALGIEYAWDLVEGLKENLGKGGVVCSYLPEGAEATWRALSSFQGGTMLFTSPLGQVSGGAPQTFIYLAEDYARRHGVREDTTVIGAFAGSRMLGVDVIDDRLRQIAQQRDIDVRFQHDLVAIDAEAREAVFRRVDDAAAGPVRIGYDLLHVTPPMRAPAVVRRSSLAVAAGPHEGYVEVDIHTLQSLRDRDVFALGDVAAIPTAKTGAAVRKQAPVLVDRLLAYRDGRTSYRTYDGYSSCPVVTAYGRVVLAEFTYGNVYAPSFPADQTKERLDMYLLERHVRPALYWHGMLRGLA